MNSPLAWEVRAVINTNLHICSEFGADTAKRTSDACGLRQ